MVKILVLKGSIRTVASAPSHFSEISEIGSPQALFIIFIDRGSWTFICVLSIPYDGMMVFSKFHGSEYCFSTLPVRMWPPISHEGRCHSHDFTLVVATLKWSRKKMVTMLCAFNSFPNSRDFFFFFLTHSWALHFLHSFLSRNLERSSVKAVSGDNMNITQGSTQNVSPFPIRGWWFYQMSSESLPSWATFPFYSNPLFKRVKRHLCLPSWLGRLLRSQLFMPMLLLIIFFRSSSDRSCQFPVLPLYTVTLLLQVIPCLHCNSKRRWMNAWAGDVSILLLPDLATKQGK